MPIVFFVGHLGILSIDSVCLFLYDFSIKANFSSFIDNIDIANSAAFIEPDVPIARVPTGMPLASVQ